MSNNSRLVLGTAQLGMPYGIAHRTGQPSIETVREIVLTAWNNGICEFDTAQAYGQSEKNLGHVFKDLTISDQVKVTTKPHPELNHLDPKCMMQALEQSLDRLNVNKLHCIMLHREDLLDLWEKGLYKILESFVQKGLVGHIGVSVYSPQSALQAIRTKGIQIIQLPTNILDRRFEKAGVFELAEEQGKEIYIRSIFLQGLLLLNPGNLPRLVNGCGEILIDLAEYAKAKNVSVKSLALGYISTKMPLAKLVIGAETADQVIENVNLSKQFISVNIVEEVMTRYTNIDEKILDPSKWSSIEA